MNRSTTVVVTYPGFDPEDALTAGALHQAGFTVRVEPRVGERTPAEVARLFVGAAAGIISTDPFDATVFAACPDLRVLARVGVGADAIDLQAATEAGVAVTITPGANASTVADHTLALILACCRRLVENDRVTRNGGWDRGGALSGIDLSGSTVGIVGVGATGRAVARRLSGFDVRILGTDVTPVRCKGVEDVALHDLLQAADIVTLHVPLVDSTRGLIAEREFELMRPGAILINTSRGAVVDESALISALRSGRVSSAGLDVFAHEPPIGSPLLGIPNVVVSPHIAGISIYGQRRMLEIATASVIDVLAGRRPAGLLNPQALEADLERTPSSVEAPPPKGSRPPRGHRVVRGSSTRAS